MRLDGVRVRPVAPDGWAHRRPHPLPGAGLTWQRAGAAHARAGRATWTLVVRVRARGAFPCGDTGPVLGEADRRRHGGGEEHQGSEESEGAHAHGRVQGSLVAAKVRGCQCLDASKVTSARVRGALHPVTTRRPAPRSRGLRFGGADAPLPSVRVLSASRCVIARPARAAAAAGFILEHLPPIWYIAHQARGVVHAARRRRGDRHTGLRARSPTSNSARRTRPSTRNPWPRCRGLLAATSRTRGGRTCRRAGHSESPGHMPKPLRALSGSRTPGPTSTRLVPCP